MRLTTRFYGMSCGKTNFYGLECYTQVCSMWCQVTTHTNARHTIQFSFHQQALSSKTAFFFAVPFLFGILPSPYLFHFTLLVSAIHILSAICIKEADLQKARASLSNFYEDFSTLYGMYTLRPVYLHACISVHIYCMWYKWPYTVCT